MTNISPTINATTASGQRVSLLNLQRASPAQAQALRQAQLRPDYLGPARQRQAARAGSSNAARTLAAMGHNVTTSLAGVGKAITGPGYLQNKTQTKQQQQYYDDYDKFLAQQNYVTRPTYKKASELADKWEKGIPSAESIERGVSAGVPSNLQGAASTFARFGRGVVLAPADLVRTVGLGAAASEYALRNPSKVTAGAVAGGLGIMARDMEAAAKENPGEFAGRVTGGVLLSKGLGKVGGPLKRAAYRVNPYYEDVAVYKGKPSIVEGLKGEQPFLTRQPTKTGTVGKVLDPDLTTKPRDYYHGTSREFVQDIQAKGSTKVGSNKPSAISEFKANRARVNTGKTVPTSKAAESALFLGAPDTAYGTFSSGGLVRIRGTVVQMSRETVALAKKRESLVSSGKRVPKKLDRDLNTAAFKDYFNAGKGDIIPSPKPLSGYNWVRRGALSDKVVGQYPEWEYVVQPGTKLYPKQSLRSKAYGKVGIRKGNKFTIDPETGETIEILDVTPNAIESEALGAPLIDIEGAISKAKTSVTAAKDTVKKKVSSTAGGIKRSVSKRTRTSSTTSKKPSTKKKPAKSKAKPKATVKDESPMVTRERKIRRKQRADTTRSAVKGSRRAAAGSATASRQPRDETPSVDDIFDLAFGVRLDTPKPKPSTPKTKPKTSPTSSRSTTSRKGSPRKATATRSRSRKPSPGSSSRTERSTRTRDTQRQKVEQRVEGAGPGRRRSGTDTRRKPRPPRRDDRAPDRDDPRDTRRDDRRDDRRNLRPSAPRTRAPPRARTPKRARRAAPLDPLSNPRTRPNKPRSGDTDQIASLQGAARKKKQHREKAPYADVDDLLRFIAG